MPVILCSVENLIIVIGSCKSCTCSKPQGINQCHTWCQLILSLSRIWQQQTLQNIKNNAPVEEEKINHQKLLFRNNVLGFLSFVIFSRFIKFLQRQSEYLERFPTFCPGFDLIQFEEKNVLWNHEFKFKKN